MQSRGPAINYDHLLNWKTANAFLGDRNECGFSANNEYITRGPRAGEPNPRWDSGGGLRRLAGSGAIGVRYHTTDVLTLCEDGTLQVNTGGWDTLSTATWISAHPLLECRIGIGRYPNYEPNPDLPNYVRYLPTGRAFVLNQRLTFSPRGRCLDGTPVEDFHAERAKAKAKRARGLRNAQSMAYKAIRRLRSGRLQVGTCETCNGMLPWQQCHLHLERGSICGDIVALAMQAWLSRQDLDSRNAKYWLNYHFNTNDTLIMGGAGLAREAEPKIRTAVYELLKHHVIKETT